MAWGKKTQGGFEQVARSVESQNKASRGYKRYDEKQEFGLKYGEHADIIFLDRATSLDDLPFFVTHTVQPTRKLGQRLAFGQQRKAFCTRDEGRCYLCEQAIKEQNMDASNKQVKFGKTEVFLNVLVVTPYTYPKDGEEHTLPYRKQVLKLTPSNAIMNLVKQLLKTYGALRGHKIRLERGSREDNAQSPRTGAVVPIKDFQTEITVSEEDLHQYVNNDIKKNNKGEITMGADYFWQPFDFYAKYKEPTIESVSAEFAEYLTDVAVAPQHQGDTSSPTTGGGVAGENTFPENIPTGGDDDDDEIPF